MNEMLSKFVELKNSRLAILISGSWGSGKTYYIKKKFLPSIEGVNKYYISLFGIEGVEDIYKQILVQKFLQNKSEKFQKISGVLFSTAIKAGFNLLSNKIGVDVKDSELNSSDILSFNNSIVVFDDLERVSPKVDLEALLGSINENFIEKDDIKVIFLADEKEIKGDVFRKYKEKIIGFNLQLEYNLREKMDSIVEEFNNENFTQFLNENLEFICEIIEDVKLKNFRTILYYLNILEIIYTTTNINNLKSLKDFLYSTFVIVVEEKSNRFDDVTSLTDVPYYITRAKGQESIKLSNTENENIFNQYILSRIRKKYNYSFSYFYYQSIFDLVHFGRLDSSSLVVNITEVEEYIEQNSKSELFKIIEELNGYIYMSNSEFIRKYGRFVEIIETESEKLRFDEVVLISRTLYYLNKKPQLRINPEKLINSYIIPRTKKIDAEESGDFLSGLTLSRLDREIGFISKENDDLSALFDSILKKSNKKYLYRKSLDSIKTQEFNNLDSYDLRVYVNTAPIQEIYEMIKNLSNEDRKLSEFTESFERALKIPMNSLDDFKQEEEVFNELKTHLEKLEKELEYVDSVWVNELISAVDKFIN